MAHTDSAHRFVHHGAFGNGRFGVVAERFARLFGIPRIILGQTVLVALWIAVNAAAFSCQWDPYPFILLNLAFSTPATYAAPLILLAQTRQAERDKIRDTVTTQGHHDSDIQREREFEARQLEVLRRGRELDEQHLTLLAQNTKLTEQVAQVTAEISRVTTELHARICHDRLPAVTGAAPSGSGSIPR